MIKLLLIFIKIIASTGYIHSNIYTNINKINTNPWKITFSYGRALQLEAMKKWGGDNSNNIEAQKIIGKRALLNSLAANGRYESSMENE